MTNILKSKLLFTVTLPLILAAGCGASSSVDNTDSISIYKTSSESMPLPAIPDSIVEPGERAAYGALHYWDSMKFGIDPSSRDTTYMEQSFANFIAMLAACSAEDGQKGVDTLIRRASIDKESMNLTLHIADKYLDDPNSPLRNEELYIYFLKNQTESSLIDNTRKEIARYRLTEAMKNRQGIISSDFRLQLRDGKTSRLHELLESGENLIMFYDSDCGHCHEITEKLRHANFPGVVKIIAIDITGNKTLWDKNKDSLPKEWTVGFDIDRIEEREIYTFRAMPTFYLLDSSGIVLLKDPSPALIIP